MPQVKSLHSSVTGEGPALILLHGLFGMGQNLAGIARAFADSYEVHSLDLRNHGRSFRADSMTFTEMAADVDAYMGERSINCACVLGHSLGGKVAMQLALDYPNRVEKLVVADIAPVAYSGHHDDVFAGLTAVNLAELASRKEADLTLQEHIDEEGVRLFILKSLSRNREGQFEWLMNVEGLQRCYDQLRQAVELEQPFEKPVLFIKGELSGYIQAKHQETIVRLFPQAQFKMIQNTGHWLHAEKPVAFNNLVSKFLQPES